MAVADVYGRIALDFFNELGSDDAESAPLSKLAGARPDRHDAHDTPYFLTWRVLSFCRRTGVLQEDGSVTILNDRKILEPRNVWDSANAHINLADGRLGSGVDELNRPFTDEDLAAHGYLKKQPIMVRESDINKGRSEVLLERHNRSGRPEKGPQAAAAYHVRFPSGHRSEQISTQQAAHVVSEIIRKNVSWKTLKRYLNIKS